MNRAVRYQQAQVRARGRLDQVLEPETPGGFLLSAALSVIAVVALCALFQSLPASLHRWLP